MTERRVRFFLKETLHPPGYMVVTPSSGEEALGQFRKTTFDPRDAQPDAGRPGTRPLSPGSGEVAPAETVLTILTAHGPLGSAMVAVREGISGYLLEPVEPHHLRHAVQEATERCQMLARSRERARRSNSFAVDLSASI